MRYLFILGRNPKLSISELRSFFYKSQNEILDFQQKDNSILLDLAEPLDAGVVEDLGGTIAIGKVLCDIKNIDRTQIYYSEKNNFSYVVWNFSNETDEIRDYLKKRFRKEKLKASEKKLIEEMELQGNEDSENKKAQHLKSKTVDEQYFVFGEYFGKIVQFSDYKEIEKRDMEKPVRRESLSISPRLAKILINLSEVSEEKGQILLDTFCGIGVVLGEALNMGIKVIGVDKDEEAIRGAKENLRHFGFSERDYHLFNEDSSKIELNNFEISGMASEPDFGETLKKIPTEDEAKKMIKRFEKIMISVLKNIKKYLSGTGNSRIVFTSPYIRIISKKRIGADFEKISEKTDLNLVEGFPLEEFREGQIIGRQIVVFELQ